MRLPRPIDALIKAATDLVYPPICMGCERAVGTPAALCAECWAALRPIERPYCVVLGTPFDYDHGPGAISPAALADPPAFERARAAVLHEGLATRLVSALKYADRTDLAIAMASWMRRAGAELLAEADILVPVPLHPRRLLTRRFNQSAELARHLSREFGPTYTPLALTRIKPTRRQVGLGARARAENVAGAFAVPLARRADVAGRRVLLVDDVFTTGSTAQSAARALRRAGASGVDVLTFSRVAEPAR